MKISKYLSLILLPLFLISCTTVTILPTNQGKLTQNPTYERSEPFYIFGLAGESHINIEEICQGKGLEQIQTQFTVIDRLLGIITFSLYVPRTVKIWCN